MAESKQPSEFRMSQLDDEGFEPGWYLERYAPAGNIEAVHGPGTVADVRQQLQTELGQGHTKEISTIVERGLQEHIAEKCRDYLKDPSNKNLNALAAGTADATGERGIDRNAERPVLAIQTDRNGEPDVPAPDGVTFGRKPGPIQDSLHISAERPLDVVVMPRKEGCDLSVVLDSDHPGDVTLISDAAGNVSRKGSGVGDALRAGDGEGSASRSGTGAGHAIRDGNGDGNATRWDEGDGNAIRRGNGDGAATRLGTGAGKSIQERREKTMVEADELGYPINEIDLPNAITK